MVRKLAHVGIAVRNLDEAAKRFGVLLDSKKDHAETVEDQRVKLAFFRIGDTHIELSEATAADSAIAKFIEKRGEGVHHLSFEVDDIRKELKRLQSAGFELIDREPKLGADGYLVVFLHPKSTHGVLVEISQKAS